LDKKMEKEVVNKPLVRLHGTCTILGESILYRQHLIEHLEDEVGTLYLHSKGGQQKIYLKDCNHIQAFPEQRFLLLHHSKNKVWTLQPDNFEAWSKNAAEWISYVRQIPLWQIKLSGNNPASWGYRLSPLLEWNVCFFRLLGCKLFYYASIKDEAPLAEIDIAGKTVNRDGETISIGAKKWVIRLETLPLAKQWLICLSAVTFVKKNKSVSNKEALLFFLNSGEEKRNSVDTISFARAEYKPRRRKSLGDQDWEF